MAYRDDRDALHAQLDALQRRVEHLDRMEGRVRELEAENRGLRAELARQAAVLPEPLSTRSVSPQAEEIDRVYFDSRLEEYVATLIAATRSPEDHGLAPLAGAILSGARPQDAGAIIQAAKARAASLDRRYSIPSDIQTVAPEILRQSILLGSAAEHTVDEVIRALLDQIEVP